MYIEFEKWLNNILEENMPIPGAAINFNLYEEADLYWSIQLICASYFDEEDEDWCCEEEFQLWRKCILLGKQRWDGKRYSIFHVK